MTAASVALALFLLTTPPSAPISRLEQAQKAFVQGDFAGALKLLDGAGAELTDAALLERAALLKAQCHAAKQDWSHAEEALLAALEANPECQLDPSKFDPTLSKLLDGVRKRFPGDLSISAPATLTGLSIDGAATAERAVKLPAGKHHLVATFEHGGETATDALVFPRRTTPVAFAAATITLEAPPPPTDNPPPVDTSWRVLPTASVRAISENLLQEGGLELGGGVHFGNFRAELCLHLYPMFGLTPRVGMSLTLIPSWLDGYIDFQVPFLFRTQGVAIGVGAMAGVEFTPLSSVALFAEAGAHYYAQNPGNLVPARLLLSGGVRFTLPKN